MSLCYDGKLQWMLRHEWCGFGQITRLGRRGLALLLPMVVADPETRLEIPLGTPPGSQVENYDLGNRPPGNPCGIDSVVCVCVCACVCVWTRRTPPVGTWQRGAPLPRSCGT